MKTRSSTSALSAFQEQEQVGRADGGAERDAEQWTHGYDFGRLRVHNMRSPAIPPKLKINQPGEKYEREADRVADEVMRMPDSKAHQGAKSTEKPSNIKVLATGRGQSLDPVTRNFMESRFGRSFGAVRIHADKEAAASSRAIGARSYTVGQDIAFGDGQYVPGTLEGRRLLAHELTHVCQQSQNNTWSTRLRVSKTQGPLIQCKTATESNYNPVPAIPSVRSKPARDYAQYLLAISFGEARPIHGLGGMEDVRFILEGLDDVRFLKDLLNELVELKPTTKEAGERNVALIELVRKQIRKKTFERERSRYDESRWEQILGLREGYLRQQREWERKELSKRPGTRQLREEISAPGTSKRVFEDPYMVVAPGDIITEYKLRAQRRKRSLFPELEDAYRDLEYYSSYECYQQGVPSMCEELTKAAQGRINMNLAAMGGVPGLSLAGSRGRTPRAASPRRVSLAPASKPAPQRSGGTPKPRPNIARRVSSKALSGSGRLKSQQALPRGSRVMASARAKAGAVFTGFLEVTQLHGGAGGTGARSKPVAVGTPSAVPGGSQPVSRPSPTPPLKLQGGAGGKSLQVRVATSGARNLSASSETPATTASFQNVVSPPPSSKTTAASTPQNVAVQSLVTRPIEASGATPRGAMQRGQTLFTESPTQYRPTPEQLLFRGHPKSVQLRVAASGASASELPTTSSVSPAAALFQKIVSLRASRTTPAPTPVKGRPAAPAPVVEILRPGSTRPIPVASGGEPSATLLVRESGGRLRDPGDGLKVLFNRLSSRSEIVRRGAEGEFRQLRALVHDPNVVDIEYVASSSAGRSADATVTLASGEVRQIEFHTTASEKVKTLTQSIQKKITTTSGGSRKETQFTRKGRASFEFLKAAPEQAEEAVREVNRLNKRPSTLKQTIDPNVESLTIRVRSGDYEEVLHFTKNDAGEFEKK
jgi:hypothetical protein